MASDSNEHTRGHMWPWAAALLLIALAGVVWVVTSRDRGVSTDVQQIPLAATPQEVEAPAMSGVARSGVTTADDVDLDQGILTVRLAPAALDKIDMDSLPGAQLVDGAVVLSRNTLAALGMETVVTESPWVDGSVSYDGPRFEALLSVLGIRKGMLNTSALDGYTISVPVEDAYTTKAILAMKEDGRWLNVGDRGPVWLIYPWSDNPELQTQTYYQRSIWQLDKMELASTH